MDLKIYMQFCAECPFKSTNAVCPHNGTYDLLCISSKNRFCRHSTFVLQTIDIKFVVYKEKCIVVFLVAQPVDCPVDIVFVLDDSGGINAANFSLMKSFVSRLVQRLDIDSGNTRVGLITFSTYVRLGFNLNAHSSVAAVQSTISSLIYQGGSTNTAAALAYVRRSMLTSAAGDRSNVPNVVVLLTDGQSDDAATAQVSI